METDSDIAIVGIGCRFPGADNIDEFWRVLVNGENHVTDIPTERWNTDVFYSEDKDAPGKIYVRKAGLIKDYDKFDPRPFGISDAEAERIDPQQRYVLECVHMAFEDGGITRKSVNGSRTGVYIGVMNDDYKSIFGEYHHYDTTYTATGSSSTVIAARVSYVYNLQGPCLVLDTACSSAMIAVHLGSQALLTGDCDMAICGGVSNIITPETFIPLCRARMMSSTGQCQTFCDTADGYARGEGCGIVILKKLSQAVNDGNKIWGIVKTGNNHDGRTAQPITSPSPEQQYKLLDTLYGKKGADPSSIQYIEMHGTGTPVGDPVETNTLGRFFKQASSKSTNKTGKLLIGSVKTNIGHTESAAGVAGLIKVLLMMQHGKIVPSLHIKKDMSNLNPAIQLNMYNLDIPVDVQDWIPNEDGDRAACVNSFGFGGTNGHAILTQKKSFNFDQKHTTEVAKRASSYVAVSAASFEGLKQSLVSFKEQMTHDADINLDRISYTSTCCRHHFSHRVCFSVNSLQELSKQIEIKMQEPTRKIRPLNLVFFYCGVGTTWTGMCSELIKADKAFRAGIIAVDKYLNPLSGISMETMLSKPTTDYSDPFLNHIAIFTTQVGLTFMWRNLGITPNIVIGQSVGEVAAAYASGSIDLKTAVDVIYHRSKILASHEGGSMMVVKNIPVNLVEKYCEQYEKRVSVAVYSSPIACTLSGETTEMMKIKADILEYSKKQNIDIFIKDLDVQCAYHSHMVEQCKHEIIQNLKPSLTKMQKTTSVISTVTGRQAVADELQSVEYWAQNIRKPVLVNEAIVNSMKENHNNVILEIGPKPVLRAHIYDIVQEGTAVCLSSMTYSKELTTRTAAIVKLYENGSDIEWKNEVKVSQLCSIPAYAFNRKKLLIIPEEKRREYQGLQTATVVDHMFLRSSWTQGKEFHLVIGKATTQYVFEHFMEGALLVPGSTYVDAVFAIAVRKLQLALVDISVSVELQHMHTPSAERDDQVECEIDVGCEEVTITFFKGNRIFSIGKARKGNDLVSKTVPVSQLIESYNKVFTKSDVYAALAKLGFKYGPSLRLIERVWYSNTDCLAEIHVPSNVVEEFNSTHIHPAVLDSVFQIFGVFAPEMGDDIIVPKGLESIRIHGYPEKRMFCYTAKSRTVGRKTYYNAILLDDAGGVICEIDDFYTQTISSNLKENVSNIYSLNWCEAQTVRNVESVTSSKLDALMFGTEETFHMVKQSFEHISVDYVKLSLSLPSTQINENKVIELTKKKKYHAVIYANFSSPSLTENHSDLIYQISKWNFLCLKDLMCILSRSPIREPLFVLTHNTQQMREHKSSSLNISGAELWGMVRCAQLESLYPDIRLLDIDVSNCDSETLFTVISDNFPSEKELKLVGNSVWKSRLKEETASHEIKLMKKFPLELGILAKLKTSQPNAIASPFLELVDYNVKNVNIGPGLVRIRLYQSCLHDKAVFPLTSCSFSQKYLLWPNISSQGFTSYSIEGEGLLTKEHTSITKERDGNTVYFCYPVDIATYVDIPKQCLFTQSEIPSYTPGLLTLSVILFSSVSRVAKGTSWTVLVDESYECCQSFIETFLEMCCECSVPCTYQSNVVKGISNQNKVLLNSFSGIIILSKLNKEIIQILLACLPNLKYIVTLPVFLPPNARHMISRVTKGITVKELHGEELFERNHLMETMPSVRSILGKCHGKAFAEENLEQTHSNEFRNVLALPCKTLSLSDNKCRLTMHVSDAHLFRKDSCYVVVGGLTGLGWLLVAFIAENGGGYIASLSRRKSSSKQQNEIELLTNKTDCKIKAYQCDITDFRNLSNTIKCIQNDLNGMQIKGIFNGAGVLDDGLLVSMTEHQVEKAFKPKILGSLNLHLATQHLDLDFFVMQSSVVSITGNAGQSNYGAANSFMDTLIHHRRSQNLSSQTINWGPLRVGMTQQNPEIELRLEQMGMSLLTADDICSLFKETLAGNKCQTVLGSFNWAKIGKQLQSTKLQDLVPVDRSYSHIEEDQSDALNLSTFQTLTDDEKERVLFELIVHVLHSVLPFLDTAMLVPDLQIGELGIDSFAAMSFVNKIFDLTGCKVPIQMILSDTASLNDIVSFIKKNINEIKQSGDVSGANDHFIETNTRLSFMEEGILLDYASSRCKGSFVMAFDYAIGTTEVGLDTWTKILRHVVIMNPELCRHFVVSSEGIAVHEISADDAEVKVDLVSVEDIGNTDPRNHVCFSLEDELPIQFKIAFDRDSTYIRVILHVVSQDLKTQVYINRDIRRVAKSVVKGHQMPKRKENPDIPRIVHALVNKRFGSLKNFWSQQMSIVRQNASINNTVGVEALDEPSLKAIEFKFQNGLAEKVMNFIQHHKLTLFQFLISVYQLFLYGETKSKVIQVVSQVDMRIHDEKLRDAFGRCVNPVPFVASFREDISVLNYFLTNSKVAISTIEHSLYPYNLILNEIPDQNMRKHFTRHVLTMDDTSEIEQLKQTGEERIDIINTWHNTDDVYETLLRIFQDTQSKTISGSFEYNERLCSNTRGKKLLSDFLYLVEICICNQNKPISSVIKGRGSQIVKTSQSSETRDRFQKEVFENITDQTTLRIDNKAHLIKVGKTMVPPIGAGDSLTRNAEIRCEPHYINQNKTILKSGFVRKQTQHGWDHKILLKFVQSGEQQLGNCYFEWGNKRVRKLPLSNIKEVQCWKRLCDNPGFVILTKKRNYAMKTETLMEAEEWVDVFQSAIGGPETSYL